MYPSTATSLNPSTYSIYVPAVKHSRIHEHSHTRAFANSLTFPRLHRSRIRILLIQDDSTKENTFDLPIPTPPSHFTDNTYLSLSNKVRAVALEATRESCQPTSEGKNFQNIAHQRPQSRWWRHHASWYNTDMGSYSSMIIILLRWLLTRLMIMIKSLITIMLILVLMIIMIIRMKMILWTIITIIIMSRVKIMIITTALVNNNKGNFITITFCNPNSYLFF